MYEIIILILLAMAPIFELRASIPYGLAIGMSFWIVLLLSIIFNLIAAVIAYLVIEYVIPILRKISWIDKLYKKWVIRTQKRAHKKVEQYGMLGLAIFIGLPVPGSGVWTGALAANILGINFRNFFKASTTGIMIAGLLVAIIIKSGFHMLGI